MRKITFFATALSLFAQSASSMAPQQLPYIMATINNLTETPIQIRYFRPDPGFYGMHVIVSDRRVLARGQACRIMITRRPITAPRCTYQLPNAQGGYDLMPINSIEIDIDPTQDNQTIVLGNLFEK